MDASLIKYNPSMEHLQIIFHTSFEILELAMESCSTRTYRKQDVTTNPAPGDGEW